MESGIGPIVSSGLAAGAPERERLRRLQGPPGRAAEGSGEEFQQMFPGLAGGRPHSEPSPAAPSSPSLPAAQRPLSSAQIRQEIAVDPERQRLYKAAQDFQSLFVKQMLDAMRKNLDRQSDPLYGGMRQDIFEDMLYDQYSRLLSTNSSFDLADQIYRQMSPALGPLRSGARDYERNLPGISTSERFRQDDWRP
ncbi:MAG: rod-binding protein [Leptospirales bacterium]|nr:rod-binding protein [Leptospirales bacterium]